MSNIGVGGRGGGGGGGGGGGVVKMSNHDDFVKPLATFDHMKPTC